MEIDFDDERLRRMAVDTAFTGEYAHAIVRRFRERIGFLRQARDESDIYAMRSFRFERLKGGRTHQFSIRLNDQWRLIVELRGEAPEKRIGIVGIEDCH